MTQPLIEMIEILPQMIDINIVIGVVQILFLLSGHPVRCIYTEDVLVQTPLGQILGRRRTETYPLGAGKILFLFLELQNVQVLWKKVLISPKVKLGQHIKLSVKVW